MGSSLVIGIGLFIFIGVVSPETSIYLGHEVPSRYVKTLRDLELIEPDETIKYFYSDAFMDIKKGLYFLTDSNLVIYSDSWAEPAIIVPLDSITDVSVDYNDSFFTDTAVVVTDADDYEYSFPLSSEKKLDRKFIDALKKAAKNE